MKKLACLIFIVVTTIAVSSCSKDDAESEQSKSVCHFDGFRKANGNPEITYTTADYDGRQCRQIVYDCLNDTLKQHESDVVYRPDQHNILVRLLSNFREKEIDVLDTYAATPQELQNTTKWRLVLSDGDAMYIDWYDERNIESGRIIYIKTKFQCVHLK